MRITKKVLKEKRNLKREKKREWIKRDKSSFKNRLLVDQNKWGINDDTDYCTIPQYYDDRAYDCVDCGILSVWTAERFLS